MELGLIGGGSTFNFESISPNPGHVAFCILLIRRKHGSSHFSPNSHPEKWSFKSPTVITLRLYNFTTTKNDEVTTTTTTTRVPFRAHHWAAVTWLVVGSLQLSQIIPLIDQRESMQGTIWQAGGQHVSLTLTTLTLAYHFCREFESLPYLVASSSLSLVGNHPDVVVSQPIPSSISPIWPLLVITTKPHEAACDYYKSSQRGCRVG